MIDAEYTGNQKRVLVIGGLGYIGSVLQKYLKEQGHRVHSVDLEWFSGGFFRQDAHKERALPNSCRDYGLLDLEHVDPWDSIVLLAGHSSVPMCRNDRPSAFRNNVVNFIRLLELIKTRNEGRQQLIYASSSGIYGGLSGKISAEEDDRHFVPQTPYDLTKWEIDQHVRLCTDREVYGLRFGTVNGGSPHMRVDLMLNQMYHAGVTRGDIQAANPSIQRPILGTEDLCRAIDAIIRVEKPAPDIYNLCSLNASVRELAMAAADYMAVPLAWLENTPSYDMQMTCAHFEKTFSFHFRQNVYSILGSIAAAYPAALKTTRSETRIYV